MSICTNILIKYINLSIVLVTLCSIKHIVQATSNENGRRIFIQIDARATNFIHFFHIVTIDFKIENSRPLPRTHTCTYIFLKPVKNSILSFVRIVLILRVIYINKYLQHYVQYTIFFIKISKRLQTYNNKSKNINNRFSTIHILYKKYNNSYDNVYSIQKNNPFYKYVFSITSLRLRECFRHIHCNCRRAVLI